MERTTRPLPSRLAQALDALRRGDVATVESLCRQVLADTPGEFRAASMLGAILTDTGRADQALPFLEQAAQHELLARYNLGIAYYAVGRLEDAVACFEAALRANPDWVDARNNLGTTLLDLGFAPPAVDVLRECLQRPGLTPEIFSNLLMAMQYLPEVTRDELATLHRRYGEALAAAHPPMAPAPGREAGPLRVGLVSGDLRHHPVGLLLEGLLPALRARGWWLSAYSSRPGLPGDPVPGRLQAQVDQWVDISGIDDTTAARRVREDCIDVLIDLSGHTGHQRLGLFARKPAPTQLSWLGYGDSTGLATIDAVVSDAVSTPPGVEVEYVESLLRLPFPRLPFTAPTDAPAVSDLPYASDAPFTFGCFNTIAKLNPRVIATWARILRTAPESRLLMKGRQFDHAAPREAIIAAFTQQGIAAERLMLEGYTRRADYYAAFHRVDVALDPFPFNGGMSTLDALWMGVPVLSLAGEGTWARQGAMILGALGLDDWLAPDLEAYVAKAVDATSSTAELRKLRRSLRKRLSDAAFAKPETFAGAFCTAVETFHRRLAENEIRRA
ncbi:tetratricopeptide repeat protein [Silanimonas sp.]|uniref:O-linked N-acetylglucosamine transferase, SPINDLY family protein n=1 Tax=Silanimonas sp. TaxID=1929290 RepID=UPI0022C5485E|nr:tetratricopeptide repeat protein [Silanimonas sp.]MCZ8165868.1 tetratricopeptide repeat protein [Silanimonas sp.]